MILRKPYAFFIKFFKFFHLIIFVLSSILLYRTSLVYNFMREFCKDSPNVIGKDLVGPLFVWWSYILVFVILAVNILIIFVLIKKVKPYMYYIFNIGLYIFVMVIFIASHRVIGNMQNMLVAARTTLAIRDFLNLARLFQTVSVIFYFIRATGFDIKKFDFVRDLQGMDISAEDSEEIEVAVEFEGNVFIRNFKRYYRNAKYYYRENRFIINIFSLLFLSFIFLFIYFGTNKYDKVYNENVFLNVGGYNIGVKSSGITSTDYKGNSIIDDDSVLVFVNLSINGNGSFPSSRAVLVVNGIQYYNNINYSSSLADLGNVYTNQTISKDFSDYLFIYKVPKNVISSNMIFRYIDNIQYKRGKTKANSIDIKLNPKNYTNIETKNIEYSLGSEININNYKLNFNSYEISNKFVIDYNSCIRVNECYDFKEVLTPVVSREREKVLLKINGNISFNDELGKSANFSGFFKNFASIDYVYDGKSYTETGDFNFVVSSKSSDSNVFYVEVDKEILSASSIKIKFNFRDTNYIYVLRGDIGE